MVKNMCDRVNKSVTRQVTYDLNWKPNKYYYVIIVIKNKNKKRNL